MFEAEHVKVGNLWLRMVVASAACVVGASAGAQICPAPSVLRTADITSSPTLPGLRLNANMAIRPGASPAENRAFFLGLRVSSAFGAERAIWQTDGTAAGTLRYSPPLGFTPSVNPMLVATSTAVYFTSSNRLYQATPEGTTQIESQFFFGGPLAVIGEHLIYALSNGVYSVRADASTADGFIREAIIPLPPSTPSISASNFARLGNELIFSVGRGLSPLGGSVYATDGTLAGTRLIRDFPASFNFRQPAPDQFYTFGSRVYFTAHDDATGRELWSTDGTTAGTTMFANFRNPGDSSAAILGAAGGKLYVRAVIDYAPPLFDTFLIAISPDGSYTTRTGAAGTRGVVMDGAFPERLVLDVGGKALFIAKSPFTSQSYDLWSTDGTGTFQGTQRLTSNALRYDGANEVIGVSVAGGTRAVVRLQPEPTSQARELWVTDGEPLGTSRALNSTSLGYENLSTNSQHLVSDGQVAHFVAPGGATIGNEPWVSDGTVAGTALVADLYVGAGTSSAGRPYVLRPGFSVYSANSATANVELFSSDGTTAGTQLVLDLAGGSNTSNIFAVYPSGSAAIIHASSSMFASAQRPFVWDGSAGPFAAPTGPSVVGGSSPTFAVNAQGKTYLVSSGPIHCLDHATLQITAVGGVSGTTIRSGYSGNYPIAPGAPLGDGAVISGTAIGTAPLPTAEPAFIGPTPAACRIIRDLTPAGAQTNPQGFTALNGGVLFFCNANSTGSEPWFTDGSSAGTVFLGDLNPPLPGSASTFNPGSWPVAVSGLGQSVEGPVVWNGRAYFPVQIDLPNNQFTSRMATTDGTPAGTAVLDLGVQVRGKLIAATGPGVFFVGNPLVGATADTELYVTDGTLNGTRRVIDLMPGTVGSIWNWLTSAGDRVYFSVGNTQTAVRGVYASDGVDTIRIDWPIAGETPSTVIPLGTVRGEFFFAGQATTTSPWTIVRTRGTNAATVSTCIAASGLTQMFVPVTNVPGQGVAISTPSRLIFAAMDPVLLQEPRAIDLCPADFNNSGNRPDMLDIFACLNAWFAGNSQADTDASGTLDSADLFAFLTAWFAGC